MRKARAILFALLAIALIVTIGMRVFGDKPNKAVTATATAEPSVVTATATPTTEPLTTPSATQIPATPSPSPTKTPEPTLAPTPIPTPEPTPEPTPIPTPEPAEDVLVSFEPRSLYVIGSGVWIRTAPNKDAARNSYRDAGEIISVDGEIGDWYKLSGEELYIFKSLTSPNREDIIPHILENYSTIMIVDRGCQHAYCYVNGELLGETDVVTGDAYSSPTPIGLFTVWLHRTDFNMMDNPLYYTVYATFFKDGIAIHDADNWRSEYGGTIYQGNGSHGCVNTPRWFAKLVYENTPIGTYVLVIP